MNKKKKQEKNTGPEPERLKIEGDWEDAVKKSFQKKRPKEGWPDAPGKGKKQGKEEGQQDA